MKSIADAYEELVMFMTSSYEMFERSNGVLWCNYLAVREHCPKCRGVLVERDRRKRIIRYLGGKKNHIMIRRMYCPACRKIHTELPDILLPHKHYEAKAIESAVDGRLNEDDPETADGPTKPSIRLWIAWFRDNFSRISSFYAKSNQSIRFEHNSHPDQGNKLPATLELLRESSTGWLSAGISSIYCAGFIL